MEQGRHPTLVTSPSLAAMTLSILRSRAGRRPTMHLALGSVLLVATLLASGCDLFDVPGEGDDGPVSGTITNASGGRVQGATVQLGTYTATTGTDGRFLMPNVAAADYTLTITAPGYITYTEAAVAGYRDRVLDREILGPNQVHGEVVNSQNGQPITGASVSFSRSGAVELQATTGADGFFNIPDAPDGVFDLVITQPGFVEYRQTGVNITGGSFSLDPIALAETPAPGTIRIVLSWGAEPSDLDAHLTGPDGAGNRFHLYYSNRDTGGATLDHDDTSSYGPETVTINMAHNGQYRYSIHNYSNQSESGAAEIAASPTRVQLYGDAGLVRSYTAPAGGQGNTWRVFELSVSGGSATVVDNGGASLGYFTASGSGDTGIFLTGGGAPAPAKGATL